MDRKEALAKELELKAQLRTALNKNDHDAEEKIRSQLVEVRKIIGSVTTEEAYGQMTY